MTGALTIGSVVDRATAVLSCISSEPRRDAELLLMHLLGWDLAALIAHPEHELTRQQAERLEALVRRRRLAEPMQYITGFQEFFGLRIQVTPDVLIPRPETELLVEAILARIDPRSRLRIVDVGTGSGAIAIALASALPCAELTAIDRSTEALAVARENAASHGLSAQIQFVERDLLAEAAAASFDVVVSNPPYIADSERLPVEVESFEPHQALFAGATGLEAFERLIPQASRALRPGGWLVLEFGEGQQAALSRLLGGWAAIEFLPDLRSIPRVAIARRAPAHQNSKDK